MTHRHPDRSAHPASMQHLRIIMRTTTGMRTSMAKPARMPPSI